MKRIPFLLLFPLLVNAQSEFQASQLFPHPDVVYSVAFSPDGKYLATGCADKKVRIFILNTGTLRLTFEHGGIVNSVAFSPDGNSLATGCSDNKARILNLNTKAIKSLYHPDGVNSVVFSPDGNFLATGSQDKIARVFDINTEQEIQSFQHDSGISSVAFSPDGNLLAAASNDNKMRIFNLKTGVISAINKLTPVRSVAFSPDGNSLAMGRTDNLVVIFNLKSREEVQSFKHDGPVYSAAYSPDGSSLATGSSDKRARILSGLEMQTFVHAGSVNSVVFSPDGSFLATGCSDKFARIFYTDNYHNELNSILFKINKPFSSAEIENQRDEEIASLQDFKKDEFETQAEFEKRKTASASKVAAIRDLYDQKISQSRQAFEVQKLAAKADLDLKLQESLQSVEYPFVLGIYNPENNYFPLTISKINEHYEINVPREFARDFKGLAPNLVARGKRQLNQKLQWEYFNFNVALQNGQSYSFGEQRGIDSKIALAASTQPPTLSANVVFVEPSGNNALDAGENGKLNFTITNTGRGTAFGVEAKLTSEPIKGISSGHSIFIGEIPPGQTKSAMLDLNSNLELLTGKNQFTFLFAEARGFPPNPIIITLDTKAYIPPNLIIADVGVSEPSGNGRIENEEIVEVTARIQNIGQGNAKNVVGNFDLGANVYKTQDSNLEFIVGDLSVGGFFDAVIKVYSNKLATEMPIYISLKESSGKTNINRQRLDVTKLALNVKVQQLQEVIFTSQDKSGGNVDIATGLSVDIEQNLPKATKMNPNGVAVIIGIRDYASNDIPSVKYAKRDAQLMRDYLIQVFGYDPKNILPRNSDELMTVGNMKSLMRQKLPAFIKPDGSSDVFVYFTGHGAPNTTSQQPFFVPYDCDPNFVNDDNAYKMIDFYADIQKLNAKKKMVVIDACFSGETGDGKTIIKNASPILLKINNPLLADKNAIVFQSSESSQVSNWYPEKKHSMFTYFFLKGIKGEADLNDDGNITVEEISKYVNDENSRLPYISRREFQRPQKAVINGTNQTVVVERQK